MTTEKVYAMKMSRVFPALLNKALRKGRTKEEVLEVTRWMTGYTYAQIEAAYAGESELSYGDFFRNMPAPNPDRVLVTGVICGVRIEAIEEPLMQEMRRLDKLVDELAKGRPMEKILRTSTPKQGGEGKAPAQPLSFTAVIEPVPDKGGAFIRVPCNIRETYGKGRLKVRARFDGAVYEGSVVNMGVKNPDGSVCYIIGVRRDIQKQIGKTVGDTIHAELTPVL